MLAPVVAIGLAAAACSSGGGSDSADSGGLVTIDLSNTAIVGDEVPLVYANATNLWKRFGLKINMINVTSSAQFSGLGAGQADIALGGAASIEAAQKGAPEAIIGSIGHVRMDFLVQGDIHSVSDLRGATIGASSPGSLLGAGQQLYLKQHGLNYPGDYNIVYTSGSFAANITALINKKTAGSFAAHPFIDTAEKGNPTLHALDRIDKTDLGILTANVATVNTQWAAGHKDAIVNFFKAWQAASDEVKTHQSQTAGYLADAAKVSLPIAQAWLKDQAALDGYAPFSEQDFRITVDALSISAPSVKSADYSKVVDNTYANAAKGES
ncbi:MAG TPA: PhnD/SsuA/transferrin family substrate-binding protein [Pseudonocardiaceae bacterium]|nr:PhnD/SsuA/transferrin family substrate-binding protein [Pseudonocardiaceae bacterium]